MVEVSDFAVIGLGRIGGNIARQALEKGFLVYGIEQGPIDDDLDRMGLQPLGSFSQIRALLKPPRVVFLFITDDRRLDSALNAVANELESGDIVIDGSESQWRDSIVRHHRLKRRGLRFVDLGLAGGPFGARNGACLMAGGDEPTLRVLGSLLRSLAEPGGFIPAGPPGSGHFAKCIHDEIETKMRQALVDGLRRLELHAGELDIQGIIEGWRHGSEIRSWLLDRLVESFRAAPHRFSERIGFAPKGPPRGPSTWKPYPH